MTTAQLFGVAMMGFGLGGLIGIFIWWWVNRE